MAGSKLGNLKGKLIKGLGNIGSSGASGLGLGGSPVPPPGQFGVSSLNTQLNVQQQALNQQSGLLSGASALGGIGQMARIQAMPIMTPKSWDDYLDGKEPTVELALEYLKDGSYDWGKALSFLMGNFHGRLKEIENQYPWQKSYDQIADEKEVTNGVK